VSGKKEALHHRPRRPTPIDWSDDAPRLRRSSAEYWAIFITRLSRTRWTHWMVRTYTPAPRPGVPIQMWTITRGQRGPTILAARQNGCAVRDSQGKFAASRVPDVLDHASEVSGARIRCEDSGGVSSAVVRLLCCPKPGPSVLTRATNKHASRIGSLAYGRRTNANRFTASLVISRTLGLSCTRVLCTAASGHM
jgi:hypothetical protein